MVATAAMAVMVATAAMAVMVATAAMAAMVATAAMAVTAAIAALVVAVTMGTPATERQERQYSTLLTSILRALLFKLVRPCPHR
jgi:hypothetical protein